MGHYDSADVVNTKSASQSPAKAEGGRVPPKDKSSWALEIIKNLDKVSD
jgi:hypothetical protein